MYSGQKRNEFVRQSMLSTYLQFCSRNLSVMIPFGGSSNRWHHLPVLLMTGHFGGVYLISERETDWTSNHLSNRSPVPTPVSSIPSYPTYHQASSPAGLSPVSAMSTPAPQCNIESMTTVMNGDYPTYEKSLNVPLESVIDAPAVASS